MFPVGILLLLSGRRKWFSKKFLTCYNLRTISTSSCMQVTRHFCGMVSISFPSRMIWSKSSLVVPSFSKQDFEKVSNISKSSAEIWKRAIIFVSYWNAFASARFGEKSLWLVAIHKPIALNEVLSTVNPFISKVGRKGLKKTFQIIYLWLGRNQIDIRLT